MDVRFVAPDLRRLDLLRCEAIALPLFEDVRPLRGAVGLVDWRLCGSLSRMLVRAHARGALSETVLMPSQLRLPSEKVMLFGGGKIGELDESRFQEIVERMLMSLDRARVRNSALVLPGRSVGEFPAERAMELFLKRAAMHPDLDAITLIEDAEAQRAMWPVVERERRRERALSE